MRALFWIQQRLLPLRQFAFVTLWPLFLLLMRLKVASIFLISGWSKLGYVLHGQIDTLYFLFEDTYKVPLLPVKLAAWMGMSGELGFGLLLALGLFARFGAIGLIVISAVIFNSDGNPLAIYWAMICAVIALCGAGKWSLDRLLFKNLPAL